MRTSIGDIRPETSSMPGDSSCSQCVKQNAREVVIPDGGEGRATRSRELMRRV